MTVVNQKKLADLLPHGSQSAIAEKLGITKQAVGRAIQKEKPNHPAVIEALAIIKARGIADADKELSQILSPQA